MYFYVWRRNRSDSGLCPTPPLFLLTGFFYITTQLFHFSLAHFLKNLGDARLEASVDIF